MLLLALTLMAIDPPPRPMTVQVVRDAITDDIRAFAIVRDSGDRLVVSCDPARFDGARVRFHSRRWLLRGDPFWGYRRIVYRFDDLPPQRSLWDINDRRARLTDNGEAASFIGHLGSAGRLVIRARDIENHEFDMTFRLKDVQPALDRALAACAEGSGDR